MYVIKFKVPYNKWKIGDEVEPYAKVYYFHSTNVVYIVRDGAKTIIVPESKVDLK